MAEQRDTLSQVRASAAQRILFLPHAIRQMARPDRIITPRDVRQVIEHGQIIEDYPEDVRGHSCLLVGFPEPDRPIHVCCAPKEGFLAVITAYLPANDQWTDDFTKRK